MGSIKIVLCDAAVSTPNVVTGAIAPDASIVSSFAALLQGFPGRSGAVGAPETRTIRNTPADRQLAAVHGKWLGTTESDEVEWLIAAAVRAQPKVVEIDEPRVPATGHAAAMMIRAWTISRE